MAAVRGPQDRCVPVHSQMLYSRTHAHAVVSSHTKL